MRIKVLTSSRAEFGIYLPLLTKLAKDKYFDLQLIVFGTHLSHAYGYTLSEIESYGFKIAHKVETLIHGDSTQAMMDSMGLTTLKFSSIWEKEKDSTDLIICLGDRYEMHAAVLASIGYGIKIAHLHGGETSLGAIDNMLRHSLSLMADVHFTSTSEAAKKVASVTGSKKNIHVVGALSLDKIHSLKLYSKKEFETKIGIPLSKDTILVTFHPETKGKFSNEKYAKILSDSLMAVTNPVLITLPNADAEGNVIRKILIDLTTRRPETYAKDSLGAIGYFSALKYCRMVLGNSSSGIIEAASFGKYAINLGNRQKGRETSKNLINCSVDKNSIVSAIKKVTQLESYKGKNLYGNGDTADKIIKVLKFIK